MTTELERYKEALGWAQCFILIMGNPKISDAERLTITKEYSNKVHKALNPEPEYEEVEETVGWVNVYQRANGSLYASDTYESENDANGCASSGRISCQPIRVTVKCEKKRPVERSVTVEARINSDGSVLCPIFSCFPFHNTAAAGKQVTLTALYTEDPTT